MTNENIVDIHQDIEIENHSISAKDEIRNKISEVGDDKTLIGIISDAASYSLDNSVMDILALSKSADSSYKKEKIAFFELLHGVESWATVVTQAQSWFDARVAKEITLPVDSKGISTVMSDLAATGSVISTILNSK